jgi:hypothetical protein
MCLICANEYEGIVVLDCKECPVVTVIPSISTLISLNCSNCNNLTTILPSESLTEIRSSNCKNLKYIHKMHHVTTLWCNNCPLILHLPVEYDTRIMSTLITIGCKWLHKNSKDMKRLVKSQRIIKKYLRRKKFNRRFELNKYMPLVLINVIVKYL